MALYKKESLEALRQRIDLVEVLSPHLDLKRAGAAYKALCPFHDEKTPSFTIQRGDSHYHCFGCGAHGDAIQFLMSHVRMSFSEAIESLAHRFQVPLEMVEREEQGPNKKRLMEALEAACELYQCFLLHTPEGHEALHYLYKRGIDLSFISRFRMGLALKETSVFLTLMKEKGFSLQELADAGLLARRQGEGFRVFFADRITIPIHQPSGAVIGFSARKYREETFGGKYVNTPETPLFKKSHVLFGLHECRRRIAKEHKAIIVEGQIDALRLIHEGFDITVAGQGTAFGEGHVKELLRLGIHHVYLALDADSAGQEATRKIGHLFQKEGIEVHVVQLPSGKDPDSFLREKGPEAFLSLLDQAGDYLTFLVRHLSLEFNLNSPAEKQELMRQAVMQIRSWNHPVMVHETLKKLAHMLQVPEELLGMSGEQWMLPTLVKKTASAGWLEVDPDRVLESDLLRWLFLKGPAMPQLVQLVRANLVPEDFRSTPCRRIFEHYLEGVEPGKSIDILAFGMAFEEEECHRLLAELFHKKVNLEKVEALLNETLKKILERNWMLKREEIKMKIQSGQCSDEEALALAKTFEELKRQVPQLKTTEREL